MLITLQVLGVTWLAVQSITTFQAGLEEREFSSGATAIMVFVMIALNFLLAGFVLDWWRP